MYIETSSALGRVRLSERIVNRVGFPDGTAAVSTFDLCSLMKISHWETGKAEPESGNDPFRMCKSEDLLEECPATTMVSWTLLQKYGCDSFMLSLFHFIY